MHRGPPGLRDDSFLAAPALLQQALNQILFPKSTPSLTQGLGKLSSIQVLSCTHTVTWTSQYTRNLIRSNSLEDPHPSQRCIQMLCPQQIPYVQFCTSMLSVQSFIRFRTAPTYVQNKDKRQDKCLYTALQYHLIQKSICHKTQSNQPSMHQQSPHLFHPTVRLIQSTQRSLCRQLVFTGPLLLLSLSNPHQRNRFHLTMSSFIRLTSIRQYR